MCVPTLTFTILNKGNQHTKWTYTEEGSGISEKINTVGLELEADPKRHGLITPKLRLDCQCHIYKNNREQITMGNDG